MAVFQIYSDALSERLKMFLGLFSVELNIYSVPSSKHLTYSFATGSGNVQQLFDMVPQQNGMGLKVTN